MDKYPPKSWFDMPDIPSTALSEKEIIEKYKTVARAVAADDVHAARVIYSAFVADGKKLDKQEVSALGFMWLTRKRKSSDRDPMMVDFLHELGFDFTQYVAGAGKRSTSGNHIPFLLLEDEDGPAILERAIDIGAIPLEIRDNRGDTLLMDALDLDLYDLAERLYQRGLSTELRNLAGQTALHIFAGKVNFRAVDWLINHGADPDANDLQFSRPSQMVPQSVGGGWDTDALYDALEDYVEDFQAGRPFQGNPRYFEMLQREISEAAEAAAGQDEENSLRSSPGP